jgi:hypothetical protein
MASEYSQALTLPMRQTRSCAPVETAFLPRYLTITTESSLRSAACGCSIS